MGVPGWFGHGWRAKDGGRDAAPRRDSLSSSPRARPRGRRMSFEDDEYWEDEYSEYSLMPRAAVIQEQKYERRSAPDPVIPTRRTGDDDGPVDELADRRRRRAQGGEPFDAQRPSWLN